MKNIFILILLLCSYSFAQSEFQVNTFSDSTQRDPQIAMDGSGNYLVVWDSENHVSSVSQSDIVFQLFNSNDTKSGSEVIVNSVSVNEQERPAAAMRSNGDFIIVWASHTNDMSSIFDIKGRLYKSNIPVGDEFLINTVTENSQTKPDVAMHSDGSFVVVWESWYQDGSNKGVYAQLFDSDGAKVGSEFLVNTTTQYSQGRPAVKYFDNGNFIVVWESWRQDVSSPVGYGMYGKIFSSSGSVIHDEFQINTYVNDYQWFGDVETFSDGSFVAAWCSWEQDSHDGGNYLQKFDQNAVKVGGEILVNKTVVLYQWLPKIKKHTNGNISVVWSSWRQDGSREGVYTQLFDSELNKLSFETQVNETTAGYQWEPTFVTGADNEILVVWAGWTETTDYEIFARRVTTASPQGYFLHQSYNHTAGVSSSRFRVWVIDSTAVTGDEYEITFALSPEDDILASIKNLNTTNTVVSDYPLDKGAGTFYLSPEFEGAAVEFIPDFEFKLDTDNSYFKNVSGTNIIFTTATASGVVALAPIDVQLIWGITDTLSDGSYATPLDTAFGVSGDVIAPFYAWSTTDQERLDMFINEAGGIQNNRWDPGEEINFVTPPQYNPPPFAIHAKVTSTMPIGNVIMPGPGDINVVLTKRPLTTDDVYRFETVISLITDISANSIKPQDFELKQNFPNPFNPTTTITFSIPKDGFVKVNIYNVLGQKISSLVNELKKHGRYKIKFNGSNLASGIYFYTLEYNNFLKTKKMLLVK